MSISASDVKELRAQTGAGMMDCKKALSECSGNFNEAVDYLRKKGLAAAQKKQGRIAAEGTIGSYIHEGRIGVLVEVNCETDFVAKNDDFKQLVKDVAMHIAASDTKFVQADEMDQDFISREREIYISQLKEQGKPENMIDKIVEGKMKKLASEVCLYDQAWVKDPDKTIQDLINEMTLKIGEKISVRRFSKFIMGEGLEKKQDNLAEEVAKLNNKQ